MYGGMNPEVTNVYFTHGSIDPWRVMGIQTDLNERSPAVVIPGNIKKKKKMKFVRIATDVVHGNDWLF